MDQTRQSDGGNIPGMWVRGSVGERGGGGWRTTWVSVGKLGSGVVGMESMLSNTSKIGFDDSDS